MPEPESTDDARLAAFLAALLALWAAWDLATAPDVAVEPPFEVHRVDVNQAPQGELLVLPGVGRVLAERIAAERERAPFRDLADLRRVHGIGPVLAARMEQCVRFGPDDGGTMRSR